MDAFSAFGVAAFCIAVCMLVGDTPPRVFLLLRSLCIEQRE